MRKLLCIFLMVASALSAIDKTFLQKLEDALLKDNALLREGVEIAKGKSSYDVLVRGFMQSLFVVFPYEPKPINLGPGEVVYQAKEPGANGRIYRLFIYQNPEMLGFIYPRTPSELSPRAQSRTDAENRLSKAREAVAWQVARRFTEQPGKQVTVESQEFQHLPEPYSYSSGEWLLKVRKGDAAFEVLFRIIVTGEAIYIVMVEGEDLSSEWSAWTGPATPAVFISGAQVTTPLPTP
ncbi:MAG: hypothetical protein Q8K75_00220 [Chlamydiales bacterium]|nr:hypothetical protein [Chlamydiales bacterium]